MSLKRRLATSIKLVVMILLVAIIVNPLVLTINAESKPPQLVYNVYEKLVKFEQRQLLVRVNTSRIALLLDEMLHTSNVSRLESMANNASILLSNLSSEYASLYLIELVKLVSSVIVIIAVIILLLKYRRAIAIRVWWFLHKNDVIVKSSSKRRTNESQEYIVFLVIIIVIAVVIGMAQYIHVSSVSFTELLLLGKNNTLSDYPNIIPVGDNVTFKIAVYNHLGYTGFYEIIVKIDRGENNLSTNAPALAKELEKYYKIIPNDGQAIIKIPIVFNKSGRYRLIFELWRYDITRHNFIYDGIWVHKWVEVVKP